MGGRTGLFMRHLVIVLLCFAFSICNAFASEITESDQAYSAPDPTEPTDTSPPAYYTRAIQANQTPVAEKNYSKLRDVLPLYQNAVMHPWPTLPGNIKLKRGAKNIWVSQLKQRLQATGDLDVNDNTNIFDNHLTQAIKHFQARHGLKPDGVVGKNTLVELNIPPDVRVKQIEINMARWASLSPQLGQRFIMVNVPDFKLYVYENNEKILSMKIIVGKVDRQTPELSSKITRLVLNPTWNVPDMIAQKDIAQKVIDNPDYLDDMHIKIFTNDNDNADEVSPDQVNWEKAKEDGVPYHLRQEPGLDNALGLVKFEFYNTDNVYLHDTPAKNLFDQDVRTFSSGCVRLEQPFALVTYLMQDDPNWNNDHQEEVLAEGKTTYVKVPHPTPIFITYITAWVDEDGVVNFRDDIYDRDQETPSDLPR